MPIKIAVDAMGGDHAPVAVVQGVIKAAAHFGEQVHIILVGQEAVLTEALQAVAYAEPNISVFHAPEAIGMGESPAVAIKTKTKSSIHIGLGLHKAGKADVFVSAGNTGAVMGASLFILGRLPNVLRPSVLSFFPTTSGWCCVVDAGTNVDCKPEHLVQFAQMGSIYAHSVRKVENPVVGLMNIGEEPGKGNELVKAAYELLTQTPNINFRGNIEGRDLLHHGADVVVCDGFLGNVILKVGEGVATALKELVVAEMQRQNLTPEQQALVGKVIHGVSSPFDYQETGAAPLLGCQGNVLIMHGSSKARAFEQAIYRAVELAQQNVPDEISAAFS